MPVVNAPRTASGYLSDFTGMNHMLNDILETIPDVQWPENIKTFSMMRNDPQLTAVLNAYTLPLRNAPKWVDPAGCRSEVVQLIADDLGLPILGKDDDPGSARRRGVDFAEHFRIALLMLVFGHMPFAQRYEIVDGRARLAELAERMPSTIAEMVTADDGSLAGIIQYGEKAMIPAKNLVWYAHEREGAAWQGRSMLRSAFGPWLIKHEMWRVMATSSRRFGMGVPSVTAPPGATDTQVRQAQELAAGYRTGDQSGIGLPNGFSWDLKGLSGSVPDTLGFIRYLDAQMAQMALASVLNLDASPNGSRALGDTFVNLMLLSLNSVGDEAATVLTRLAVQMVDYNFGEDEPAPRIVIGDAGSNPEVTAEAIVALIGAGAITPDPDLEAWVRERYSLPRQAEPAPAPAPAPVPPGVPDNAPAGMPGATGGPVAARRRALRAASWTADRRNLYPSEINATVDPEKIDGQWQTALASLLRNWSTISRAQRQEITDQIAAAIDNDKVDNLAALAVDSSDAAQTLSDALLTMAQDAATEARNEAKRQGVTVPDERIDETRMAGIASAVATMIAASYATAAGREAIRVWTDNATGADVADMVDTHLRSLSDSYLSDQLGSALSTAQNHGRLAVMRAAPAARYYSSEVLDTNTCKKCRAIDGTEFDDLDAAGEAYASGGYVECLGRLRCRGIVVAVWND